MCVQYFLFQGIQKGIVILIFLGKDDISKSTAKGMRIAMNKPISLSTSR